jgi:deazaflavin-dependent oxidoreductase (nitroreductase family)
VRRGRAGRPLVARSIRLLGRPRSIVTRLTRAHAALLRASRGRWRRSLVLAGGQPVLSLTTTGRRSGRPRSTAVAYLCDGDAYVLFAQNLGSRRDPAWALNLGSNPRAQIEVDGTRIPVSARRAGGEEADRLWARYVERLPAAEDFRRIAGRDIPIFVLEPDRHSGDE